MPDPDPNFDSNQLMAVCKVLYRECAIDMDVEASDIMEISMKDFVEWCVAQNLPMERAEEFTGRLGLTETCCKTIDKLFRGDPWQCAAVLAPVWFTIVLQHRPPIQNAIQFTNVVILVGFRDNKVMKLEAPTELSPGIPRTDGFLTTLMQSQADQLLQLVAHLGFDKLHDDHAQQIAETKDQLSPPQPLPNPPIGKIGWQKPK